jgi:hypothetical protein
MKNQTKQSINAHLLRSAFILLALLAVCVIPFALGQRTLPGQRAISAISSSVVEPPIPSGLPCTPGWSAGGVLPSVGVRFVGVYFPANGKFYAMGGRAFDGGGGEFTHPFEYDPITNTWTTKSATYTDNQVNNMGCGVLTESGTPYIYCVGGSESATSTTTGRTFRYDPITDTLTNVATTWPPGASNILPGGFSVFSNKLYVLGGFNVNVGMDDRIWEFTPPSTWVQKTALLPVQLGYIPTTTIGSLIYTGGGSTWDGTTIHDSTNSFVYDPVADTIGTIATIPRATAETRALTFKNPPQMWVMGGGRDAPNPSSEVDVYDPVANSWSLGPAFTIARRNFATDTNGTDHIWLAGGYAPTSPTDSTEVYCQQGGTPTPTPTGTPTPSPTPPCQFQVLIAYADIGGLPTMIQNEILAEPGVTAVDLFDAFSGTPTLPQLQQYDIVFAFSNNFWADATAMGDVLADYEDAGGVVVVGTFAWDSRGGWNLAGRWMTGGYTPYNSSAQTNFSNNTANITQPGHPLMQGVVSLSAFYRNGVTLTAGAASVADWTDGPPAVAYKTNNGHTAVGLNAYLGYLNAFSGEWGRVIVNAGRWLIPCGVTPTPSPTATATATATATPTATPTVTPRSTPTPRPQPTRPPRP